MSLVFWLSTRCVNTYTEQSGAEELQAAGPRRFPLPIQQLNGKTCTRLPCAESVAQRGKSPEEKASPGQFHCLHERQRAEDGGACRDEPWQRRPLWRRIRPRATAAPLSPARRAGAGMNLSSGHIRSRPNPSPDCPTRTPEQRC